MTSTLPTDLIERPIQGQGLSPHTTLGSLLAPSSGPILLVFLRHHG